MSFAGSLHLAIFQLEPEEPTLLDGERKTLPSPGVRLRSRDPAVMFLANLDHDRTTGMIVVQDVVPLSCGFGAILDWAATVVLQLGLSRRRKFH